MERVFLALLCLLSGCASLEQQTALINSGDSKEQVLEAMGEPADRQFRDNNEAWQYCKTGAGFGYHDFRTVWFRDGRVVGLTSYKDHTPATGCTGHFKPIEWATAPQ